MAEWTVRDYAPGDETPWLRCRVLAFLDTTYYDDVATIKPRREAGLELVAAFGDQVVGILDASVTGSESTIETIAVHPDYRRLGIAQRLLNEICDRLQRRGATQVDAWTRDDEGTLAWYRSQGFEQKMRYLHVYASDPDEAVSAFGSQLDLMPRAGFFHAWLDHEDALRNRFSRVYSCRQFVKALGD
ncbi:GNAT family N-acetyltransferase [Kribbella sp. NBC_01484]|uniref:GNAT family N-acetyltransferase n=1 Tax=Kribbella sp. NBC_01484 TaxID=2903579 RepID=UPI002E36A2C7|nr:GNAT family N-acetyltransferase [Kribbella sp. NBC_01484]